MTTHDTVTLEAVERAAAEVVKELGEGYRLYPGECTYTQPDDDEKRHPNCLVGQIMHKLGWTAEEMLQWDFDVDSMSSSTFPDVVKNYDLAVEPAALRYLTAAQVAQDGGRPWGDALKHARLSVAVQDWPALPEVVA